MSEVKCCKPKCNSNDPTKNACDKENIKAQEKTYFILFIFLNIVVIFARFKELDFNKYKNGWDLVFFVVWLEIQILFVILILSLFMRLLSLLSYNWKLIKKNWILLISPYKPYKISKKIGAEVIEEIVVKVFWYFLQMVIYTVISLVAVTLYLIFLLLFGPILLGYTKIY
jgi:hypothetical protein